MGTKMMSINNGAHSKTFSLMQRVNVFQEKLSMSMEIYQNATNAYGQKIYEKSNEKSNSGEKRHGSGRRNK